MVLKHKVQRNKHHSVLAGVQTSGFEVTVTEVRNSIIGSTRMIVAIVSLLMASIYLLFARQLEA